MSLTAALNEVNFVKEFRMRAQVTRRLACPSYARGWPSRPGGVIAVPAGIPQPLHLALHYFCRQSRTPVSANTRRPSR